ncbi:hypothetical protein BGZ82_009939 [Podila clonocystis]|nr:hypothetical protein BGZ82_009939 [Podila clonocystis]
MNLSAILNDPGATLPTNHSRTKSGATSPSHDVHRFDNNHPSLDDYYDHRSDGSHTNNGYHHDANTSSINANYTNGSESRKHASSVSVNQLEQLAAVSNGNDNLSGPNHDHPMHSHDYHPSESGKGKIRPNESSNTYSTSTFRAAPRASFANSGKTTSPPSSSLSSPVASTSPATFHTMTTASSPSSLVPTTAITSQTTTAVTGAKESSTNSPIAKKKPRQQQEIVFSSSDLSHDPDGRSSKKKPGRKTSTPTSGQGHDDPFEIRFVITDKDGLDKSKNVKASASSSVATPVTTSTSQDSQDEDTGDQDTSESSPQPDFERNAEGKYRCSWPRCGKEFTVASRLTTHFRIHNGKPPYLCGYKDCQKAFHTSSSLSHHRVVHTDQGLRPYICRHNRCGATYTQLARLITHQRTTHSGMILFIPQPNAQSEGTTGSTSTGTGTGTGVSTPSSFTTNVTANNNTNSINNNTPTSPSPSTPSGAPVSAQSQASSTISPISPHDRQRGETPVSMSGTSGTISPMGEPSRSPHEPLHDKNNPHRAYSYNQAPLQAFSPTSGHGYPSQHGRTHRPETQDGHYEDSEQGLRDRPGDGFGRPPQHRDQCSQDEEFDNEENLSPEERSRREAALTMTSFREIAMVQHVPYEQQQQQQHPSQRNDYFGDQYYQGQPSNIAPSSRPGEYWNQVDYVRMSEGDRGYANYDDRRPSSSPGHPQYPERFNPGSNEHQNQNQSQNQNQNQARRP